MTVCAFPVPWSDGTPDIDLFLDELASSVPEPGSAHDDLLTALRHGRARVGTEPVRLAQAVLEISVEWRMPAAGRARRSAHESDQTVTR